MWEIIFCMYQVPIMRQFNRGMNARDFEFDTKKSMMNMSSGPRDFYIGYSSNGYSGP